MQMYAGATGVPENELSFNFDGLRIGDVTPQSLEMEDDDVIHAFIYQTGD
jgi:hypothetical protein